MEKNSIDYGPLAVLIGSWTGDKGVDIAPDPEEGREENPYYETISFEGVGYAKNAEEQLLVAVRYLQVVRRKSDDEVFHDQTGHWMWDKKADTIMHSISIPRGVCVLSSGKASQEEGCTVLDIKSDADGIVQSPFMKDKAKTLSFEAKFSVSENELSYRQTTMLDIYSNVFEHTDTNVLGRV